MSAISFSWINVTMCVTNSLSNVVSRRDFMQRYKVLQLSFHNFHNTIEVHLEEGWRLVMQSSQSCKTDLFLSITNLSFYSSKFDILHQSTTFKKLETALTAKKIQLSCKWLIWVELSQYFLFVLMLFCLRWILFVLMWSRKIISGFAWEKIKLLKGTSLSSSVLAFWLSSPAPSPKSPLARIILAYLPGFDLLKRKLLFSRMKIALLQFLKIYDCYVEPLTSS